MIASPQDASKLWPYPNTDESLTYVLNKHTENKLNKMRTLFNYSLMQSVETFLFFFVSHHTVHVSHGSQLRIDFQGEMIIVTNLECIHASFTVTPTPSFLLSLFLKRLRDSQGAGGGGRSRRGQWLGPWGMQG